MSDPEMVQELASSDTGWDEPNERTAAVDDALVRACRALDACADALSDSLRRDVTVEVESEGACHLEFAVHPRGRWTFIEGTWVDPDGSLGSSTLLRPTLRAIARSARPRHAEVLTVVVHDLELAAGALISVDAES